jgi:hypothetical protein
VPRNAKKLFCERNWQEKPPEITSLKHEIHPIKIPNAGSMETLKATEAWLSGNFIVLHTFMILFYANI